MPSFIDAPDLVDPDWPVLINGNLVLPEQDWGKTWEQIFHPGFEAVDEKQNVARSRPPLVGNARARRSERRAVEGITKVVPVVVQTMTESP
jgi:hypothetical protein